MRENCAAKSATAIGVAHQHQTHPQTTITGSADLALGTIMERVALAGIGRHGVAAAVGSRWSRFAAGIITAGGDTLYEEDRR